jgi:hypothetical protein
LRAQIGVNRARCHDRRLADLGLDSLSRRLYIEICRKITHVNIH